MAMSKLQQQLKKKEKERKNAGPAPVSAEAKAKSAADRTALQCAVCKQTFAVTTKARGPTHAKTPDYYLVLNVFVIVSFGPCDQARELSEHAASKHAKVTELACFPAIEEIKARDASKGK
jgi:hypothetical protein